MAVPDLLILAGGGLLAGILAGFLGIGGGMLLVPLLVGLGYQPIEAVATSALSIFLTSVSGTVHNWRQGYIQTSSVLYLGLPALGAAQLGVYLAELFPPQVLLFGFGVLLLINILLFEFHKRVVAQKQQQEAKLENTQRWRISHPIIARLITGGLAGILAGLFGVGGGVIMVPLQILLLNTAIKPAVQTSLAVIVITSISACVGHAIQGNILLLPGLLLGFGGLTGAQISARFLPRISDRTVSLAFRGLLVLLSIYTFWQSWHMGK